MAMPFDEYETLMTINLGRGNGWLPWDEWDQMYATHDDARAENGQRCLFQ